MFFFLLASLLLSFFYYQFNIVILLFFFNLGLCFKTENSFGAQFDELENVYKITKNVCTKI